MDVEGFVRDLEALKLRLIGVTPADIPAAEAGLLAEQISAIRLQLKRLAADRDAMAAEVARVTADAAAPPPEPPAPLAGP